jgi:hypothetical protein
MVHKYCQFYGTQILSTHVPLGENKCKLIQESRLHLWDDPYLFRVCSDGLLRKCVPTEEAIKIIERCHSSPYGGHYGAFRTLAKFGNVDFSVQLCMKTQKISSRDVEHVRGMGT